MSVKHKNELFNHVFIVSDVWPHSLQEVLLENGKSKRAATSLFILQRVYYIYMFCSSLFFSLTQASGSEYCQESHWEGAQ